MDGIIAALLKRIAPAADTDTPAGKLKSDNPNLRAAWETVMHEMPDAVESTPEVRPASGFIEKLLLPKQAEAITLPFSKRVIYNPEVLEKNPRPVDTLTHELTHVRQLDNMSTLDKIADIAKSIFVPYDERKHEKEAFGEEQRAYLRRLKKDVQLK